MAEDYKRKGLSPRRLLFGDPLSTSQLIHERLTKIKALAVFASDALSSSAYATEEMMLILILAGSSAAHFAWPLAIAIAVLLAIVASSYNQTIHAYPNGGGSYIVSHDNLGQLPGLTAAASLLTDYVLTVSVSISAGVAALTSMVTALYPYRVLLGLGFIMLMMVLNLRGVRESGTIFSIPTYIFLVIVLVMIAIGIYKWIALGMPAPTPPQITYPVVHSLTLFLILRAFSSGCAALTGVEAISNGVPAFKPPEAKNAAATLTAMAGLLITLFLGVTFLSRQFGVLPNEFTHETLISQLGRAIFGSATLPYYVLQAATAMILVLAANTSFADFPRLASLLARDRYLPRQFSYLGDRLAFSNGIIVLAGLSSLLIILFGGTTTRLIPLYALGVFLSFTLSQLGMVMRWRRIKGQHWQIKALVNGIGAVVTGVVLIIFALTKFVDGAWIVIVWIPIFISFFLTVHRHYESVARQLSLETHGDPSPICRNRVVVPIGDVHRAVLAALHYAQSLSDDVTAVYVETDPTRTPRILEKWKTWGKGIHLEVLPSPYRSILHPLVQYVDQISDPTHRDEVVTIVLPQFVTAKPWQQLLHNQTAFLIQMAFLFRREVIVVNVPFHLREASV
ncbi:MAG TPA: APC family permease [Anaerolineae bacterium]|nr:APC family permease [Anaerolineae bacterium]HQI86282.1 APC family permease [Anaerolineae bacterium]